MNTSLPVHLWLLVRGFNGNIFIIKKWRIWPGRQFGHVIQGVGFEIWRSLVQKKTPLLLLLYLDIVNRGDWLGSLANIKGTNKDAKIYVGWSTTLHNLLFCTHTLCMIYVTNTFLLVGSSVRSKQLLCFVQGQSQKTEQ